MFEIQFSVPKLWFWTAIGIVLGIVSVAVWLLTFQPHGGVELSAYLFPGTRWLLIRLYPHENIPVPVFYWSAFLHWPIVGTVIDLFRLILRNAKTRNV